MSPAPTPLLCRYCRCPQATDEQWESVPPGEGEELGLCWGECGVDAEQALDNALARLSQAERLAGALKPFAALVPSSFYPADGSEREGYEIILAGSERPEAHEFTGADIATARKELAAWEASKSK